MITRTGGLFAAAMLVLLSTAAVAAAATTYTISSNINISATCSGQNAEVLQAVDRKVGYVYEEWMGCRGIAFARSTDGGRTFDTPISVPGRWARTSIPGTRWSRSRRTGPSTQRS